MAALDFMFFGQPAGCFMGPEYPQHDGRWPYDEYRGPGHSAWVQELIEKQKASCYYDTDQGRVFFTTRHAPGLLKPSTIHVYRFVDLSEFKRRPWVPVTPRQPCILADLLHAVQSGNLPPGWIYFSDGEALSIVTKCLLLPHEDVGRDERGVPAEAARHGFRRQGLSTDEMGTVMRWAREIYPSRLEEREGEYLPGVDDLLRMLVRFSTLHPDAFPQAPPPSPPPTHT